MSFAKIPQSNILVYFSCQERYKFFIVVVVGPTLIFIALPCHE